MTKMTQKQTGQTSFRIKYSCILTGLLQCHIHRISWCYLSQ